jgi:hypothetical protein
MKLKPLMPDQEASLRLAAVQRILASEAVPAQHLRSSVLAALASRYHLLPAPHASSYDWADVSAVGLKEVMIYLQRGIWNKKGREGPQRKQLNQGLGPR